MRIKTVVLSSLSVLTLGAVALAGPRGGHSFERLDADSDGQVTAAEMKQAAVQRIVAADTNGDGAASAEELQAQRKAHRSERQAKHFETMDKNSDGVLTPDEVSRMPEAFFQKLDTDNSGSLSAEELAAKHGKRHQAKRRGGQGRGKMLSRMDTNGDGKVDTSEAEAMATARFTKMDTNADGVLTVDEMKHRGGRGKHHKGQGCGQTANKA